MARIMYLARAIEKRPRRHEAPGWHGGQLGRMAVQLLEAMRFMIDWSRGPVELASWITRESSRRTCLCREPCQNRVPDHVE